MNKLKLVIAFLVGVALTLALTGNLHFLPAVNWSAFVWPRIRLDNDFTDVLAVLAMILLGAFIATRREDGPGGRMENALKFLREFRASKTDHWLGGICGGLGQRTSIPAWIWRLGFALAFFCYGSGFLAYILLWIFVPQDDGITEEKRAVRPPGSLLDFLHGLKRSTKDRWLGGVCGGLAEQSAAPAWVWRLGFVALTLFYGSGVLAYLLLWIFVPKQELKDSPTA